MCMSSFEISLIRFKTEENKEFVKCFKRSKKMGFFFRMAKPPIFKANLQSSDLCSKTVY